jgi:small subunit ribosomal protein S4
MARYTGPTDKLSRREGVELLLKGDRSFTDKAGFSRRPYPPGQHGQGRTKFSEFGTQLREKQKVKRYYGVLERQFRQTFKRAEAKKGITGENLLKGLESRVDNLVYRCGFARSRPEARQLVVHGHFLLNGRKVGSPSLQVKPGDVLEVREKSRKLLTIIGALEGVERRGLPSWIEVDKNNFKATVKTEPSREEIQLPINEQLIVELYSK